jgi:multiple sugar transport system permease protein/N,N'-diacetylchitobiose transport system permease protein
LALDTAEAPPGLRWSGRVARLRRAPGSLAFLLLLPSLLVVFGVVLYPLIRTIITSVHGVDSALPGAYPFVGAHNYSVMLHDPEFWSSLLRTVYFTFVTTALELTFGILLGLLLNQQFRGRAAVRALVIIPWAVPTVVSGAMWRWIFNGDYGALNALLTQLHLISTYHQWLASPNVALHMVMIEDIWKFTPFVALFILAGLQTIPDELHEAGMVDGAGSLRRFFSITLPLLTPVILVTAVLRTIDGFRLFDIIYVMTGGGPSNGTETTAFYTYERAFSDQSFGLGSAIAIALTLLTVVVTIFYMRVIRVTDGT